MIPGRKKGWIWSDLIGWLMYIRPIWKLDSDTLEYDWWYSRPKEICGTENQVFLKAGTASTWWWIWLIWCEYSYAMSLIITSFEGWMYSVAGFLTSSSTGGFIVSPSSWKSFGFPHGTFWNVFTMRHHTTSLWAFAASRLTASLYALDKSRPALRMIAIIPQLDVDKRW